MEDFVNKIVVTAFKLKGTGLELSDELVGAFMLAGLPEEYMPMIMAIENSGTVISADLIKTKLLQEMRPDSNSASSSAMVSRMHGTRQPPKFTVTCYGCGEEEHYRNKCPNTKDHKKHESHSAGYLSCFAVNHINSSDWFVDSGATAHMTNNKGLLMNMKPMESADVTVANDTRLKAECCGDVILKVFIDEVEWTIFVSDVLYVPGLCANLLSVSKMVGKGLKINFASDSCKIVDNNEVIGEAALQNGMYRLNQEKPMALLTKTNNQQELWNRRLGHIGQGSLNTLKNGKERGERVVVEPARGTARGSSGHRLRYNDSYEHRGGGGRYNDKYQKNSSRYGPPLRTEYRLIVENLSSRVSWQDLKDYMRQAGEVTYADAHQRRNEGVVEFASHSDMKTAIEKLDDTELSGRRVRLVEDRRGGGGERLGNYNRNRGGQGGGGERNYDRRNDDTKSMRSGNDDDRPRIVLNPRTVKDPIYAFAAMKPVTAEKEKFCSSGIN